MSEPVDPTAPVLPVSVPQRLQVVTVRPTPESLALLRLETWTEGSNPQFYFLTPTQALGWAERIVRQAMIAQAWNAPAVGPM